MTAKHSNALDRALVPALHDAHADTVYISLTDSDENGTPKHYVVEFTRYVQVDATSPFEALTAAQAKLHDSGWSVECTPPGQPRFFLSRPCESAGHAAAVLAGLPSHYRPARVRTPGGRS